MSFTTASSTSSSSTLGMSSTSTSTGKTQIHTNGYNTTETATGQKRYTTTATKMRQVPWTQHTMRQLKLVLPGAAVTYYLGTLDDFWGILAGTGGSWAQTGAFAASALGLTTITLFLYVLLVPWLTGEEPNYQTWRDSGILSSVIPILTGSIVIGWLLAVSTLGQWSALGYLKGTIGVSAFYALTFGILGLIPVPRANRKTKPL